MAYRIIDMKKYPRKAHFDYFRSLAYPYVGVTANVDVTALADFCKAHGVSFYLTFMHAAALAADSIPEFRQRIRDGGIVQYDACPTSHTEALPDGTYCYCTLHHHVSYDKYIVQAEAARARSRERASIEEDEAVESMYFVSSLPWLHYMSMIQPVAGGDESNPRITWGKYEADHRGRLMLPVTVLLHHALADGLHLGQFYQALEGQITALSTTR